MTNERRKQATELIDWLAAHRLSTEHSKTLVRDYMTEHERMRKFIRNLADESRVYLESEE